MLMKKCAAAAGLPKQPWSSAQQSRQKLLPRGQETPGHHFLSIVEEQSGQEVGCIWYGLLEEAGQTIAFVYDFLIYEEHRRKGYGLQALQALDEEVRRSGLKRIALHVFGHNQSAQALYEKAGYTVVDFIMAREPGMKKRSHTRSFGAGTRISHDASAYYDSRLYAGLPAHPEAKQPLG